MRKILFNPITQSILDHIDIASDLNLEKLSHVELTSEQPEFPIEAALINETEHGWRAKNGGVQSIRLVFDEKLAIGMIFLVFEEFTEQRTQEFVLRWSTDNQIFNEILRQQFHFSPPDTVREIEQYAVNLFEVKALELEINPGIDNNSSVASLRKFRLR